MDMKLWNRDCTFLLPAHDDDDMQLHKRDTVSGKYSVRVTLSLLGISSQSSSYKALVSLSSSNLKRSSVYTHGKVSCIYTIMNSSIINI